MSLLRTSLFVGMAGLVSRPLGFLRDVLIAAALGAGPVADAFVVASRLPDLLRKALNEGGLNGAFVPLHAGIKAEGGPTAAARFAGEALSGLALVLAALTALVEVAAGLVVLALAAGYGDAPATLGLAAACLRLAFPFVVGAGLASLLGALLNAERRFAMAALAPLALNVVAVLTLLALARRPELGRERVALWLSAAIGLSGFVQLGLVAAALLRRPAPLRLAKPRLSPQVKRLLTAGLPALALSASVPLIVLAGMQAASFTPSALSWLYYAERVASLPIGFVGAAVSAVLLPAMAGRIAAGDRAGFVEAQNRALEAACLLAFPAAAALALLGRPIAAVLFERGAFGPQDTAATASAMAGLAAGLPFAVAGKVFLQAFFAGGSLAAALLATVLAVAATGLAALALAPALGVGGIGLAISLGIAAQAAAMALALHRTRRWHPDAALGRRLLRAGAATAIMAFGLRLVMPAADGLAGPTATGLAQAATLAVLCLAGFAIYALAAVALRAVTREDLATLRRRA